MTTMKGVTKVTTSSSLVSSFPPLTLEVIMAFMRVGVVMIAIMLFWLIRCKEDWKSLLWCYFGSIILSIAVIGGYLW